MSIKRFKCADTKKLFSGYRVRRWLSIERATLRKLEQLDWSVVINDLRVPPGNRLELLKGYERDNIVFVLMISGECVLFGPMMGQKMLK